MILYRVFVPTSTLFLFCFETIVIISAFTFSSNLLIAGGFSQYIWPEQGAASITFVSLSVLAGVYFQDLYTQVRVKSKLLLAQQLLMALGITFLMQALLSATTLDLNVPLRIMLFSSAIAITIMFVGRLFFNAYVLSRMAAERMLLMGASPLLEDIAGYLDQHPQLGMQIAGRIATSDTTFPTSGRRLGEQIRAFDAKHIVVGMQDRLSASLANELLELGFLGYSIQEATETYAKICNREGLNGLDLRRLLYSKEFEPNIRALMFQAIGNRLFAAVCIIVLLPLMLFIAILVRLFLGRTALERRIRAGRDGAPYNLYSFAVSKDGSNSSEGVGRILSRTGLYALPQLFNVLRGDMLIVGPRPQRPEFIQELTQHLPFYPHRLKVYPGMTGWSQIHMRDSGVPPDCMMELEYDLYYIKSISLAMDVFIFTEAIKNVLVSGGRPLA